MNLPRLLLIAALACTPALAQPVTAAAFDLRRPEIVAFIDEVAARDGISKKQLRQWLKASAARMAGLARRAARPETSPR